MFVRLNAILQLTLVDRLAVATISGASSVGLAEILPSRGLGRTLPLMDDAIHPQNTRVSPRVPLYARVELPYHPSGALRAHDISLSGMRVLSRDGRIAHWPSEKVHLRFKLPGCDDPIEATARIVGQRDAGNDVCVGLRFETMTTTAAVSIYRFITRRSM
jgi:hypothetical protein